MLFGLFKKVFGAYPVQVFKSSGVCCEVESVSASETGITGDKAINIPVTNGNGKVLKRLSCEIFYNTTISAAQAIVVKDLDTNLTVATTYGTGAQQGFNIDFRSANQILTYCLSGSFTGGYVAEPVPSATLELKYYLRGATSFAYIYQAIYE